MMPSERFLILFKYLPLLRKLSLVAVAAFPMVLLVAVVFGGLNPDYALALISVTFTVALIPGVLQCYATKTGWSKMSCDQTGFGLFGMAGIFYFLTFAYGAPLFITATTTLVSGAMWMILLAQAFRYGKGQEIPVDVMSALPEVLRTFNFDMEEEE